MNFHVRSITLSDLPVVNATGEEKGWALAATPNGVVRLAGEQREPNFAYLCTTGDAVLGWVYGAYRSPEHGYIAIDRIIVAPPYRRRGIARALVEHILLNFPGVEVLMSAWDAELTPFYASLGFHEAGDGTMTNQP